MNQHYRQAPKSGKKSRAKSPKDDKEEKAGVGMQTRESQLQCSSSLPKNETVIAKMLFFTLNSQLSNYEIIRIPYIHEGLQNHILILGSC